MLDEQFRIFSWVIFMMKYNFKELQHYRWFKIQSNSCLPIESRRQEEPKFFPSNHVDYS